jgi:hypothetical protein
MHPNPGKERRDTWWDCRPWGRRARFHLCLRQGAGRQFAWLEADSCKVALSRPTHAVATGTPAKYAGAGREPLGAKRKEELGDGMRT